MVKRRGSGGIGVPKDKIWKTPLESTGGRSRWTTLPTLTEFGKLTVGIGRTECDSGTRRTRRRSVTDLNLPDNLSPKTTGQRFPGRQDPEG